MTALFVAIGIGIVSYFVFVMMFPKAMPQDPGHYLAQALNRLYEENRANEIAPEGVLRDQLGEESPLVRTVFSWQIMRPLYEAGLQAGYARNMKVLAYMMLGSLAVLSLLLWKIGMGYFTVILAPAFAYYIPYRHCKKRVSKRNRKFLDLFPDALDMIVRSVRSGFPLSVALQMLAENMEDPVREEFRQVVDEVALGRSMNESLARLAIRINEPDIRFFVVVLTVQQETGGNLAEIIGNLSGILRKRKQLRHKIKAMTAEGRATGWVLGGLPVFVFVMLYFLQPGYLQPFFHDSLGKTLLMVVGGLMVTCYFIVRQIIRVEI